MKFDPVSCEKCLEFEGTIARVFSSQEEFMVSPFYGGEDKLINDPIADVAVWPGKSNALFGSDMDSWWLCAPVHPNCSHIYEHYDMEEMPDFDEGISDIRNEMGKEFAKQFGKDFPLARALKKSSIYTSGVWEECECSHHSLAFSDNDNWLHDYLEWKLQK